MAIKQKSIYKLVLHESTTITCGICIMRVPGGWLYDMWDHDKDTAKLGVFVPLDYEFKFADNTWKHDERVGTEL